MDNPSSGREPSLPGDPPPGDDPSLGGSHSLAEIRAALQSPDVESHRAALWRLSRIRIPEGVDLLRAQLSNPVAETRIAAALYLHRQRDGQAASALIDAVMEEDERLERQVDEPTRMALLHAGDDEIWEAAGAYSALNMLLALLAQNLADTDTIQGARAAEVVGAMLARFLQRQAAELRALGFQSIWDPDLQGYRAAMELAFSGIIPAVSALRTIAHPAGIPALSAALQHDDGHISGGAWQGLLNVWARHPEPEVREAIISAAFTGLRAADSRARSLAADLLVMGAGVEALPRLLDLHADSDPRNRSGAVEALGRLLRGNSDAEEAAPQPGRYGAHRRAAHGQPRRLRAGGPAGSGGSDRGSGPPESRTLCQQHPGAGAAAV